VPKRLRRSFSPNSSGAGQKLRAKSSRSQPVKAVQRIALDMNRGATDAGEYVGDAHRSPVNSSSTFWNLSTAAA